MDSSRARPRGSLLLVLNATEAELNAIEEGMSVSLQLQWTALKLIVETDCAEAIELIKDSTPNTSICAFRVSKIRDLIQKRDIKLIRISHDVNVVSHELAKIGRVQARTAFWPGDLPRDIAVAMTNDSNPVSA